eukprot:8507314-Pyramimonas_sp.AAC.1
MITVRAVPSPQLGPSHVHVAMLRVERDAWCFCSALAWSIAAPGRGNTSRFLSAFELASCIAPSRFR